MDVTHEMRLDGGRNLLFQTPYFLSPPVTVQNRHRYFRTRFRTPVGRGYPHLSNSFLHGNSFRFKTPLPSLMDFNPHSQKRFNYFYIFFGEFFCLEGVGFFLFPTPPHQSINYSRVTKRKKKKKKKRRFGFQPFSHFFFLGSFAFLGCNTLKKSPARISSMIIYRITHPRQFPKGCVKFSFFLSSFSSLFLGYSTFMKPRSSFLPHTPYPHPHRSFHLSTARIFPISTRHSSIWSGEMKPSRSMTSNVISTAAALSRPPSSVPLPRAVARYQS